MEKFERKTKKSNQLSACCNAIARLIQTCVRRTEQSRHTNLLRKRNDPQITIRRHLHRV